MDPVGKLCSYWPEVNNAISKRNKKVRSLADRVPAALLQPECSRASSPRSCSTSTPRAPRSASCPTSPQTTLRSFPRYALPSVGSREWHKS